MKRNNYIWLVFSGVAALFLADHSVASAANTVVVIPLSKTTITTCTAPDEVQSAGYCWKDRNLGASRVAMIQGDTYAYGALYQWGRLGDGHQNRTSLTTTYLSNSDVPGHNNFIKVLTTPPYDWRTPQNNNLWQGLSGDNNPCPQGFRLPTETELEAEIASWGVNDNAVGALASPLHLVLAGYRSRGSGSINFVGVEGRYWSSTIDSSDSRKLHFTSNGAIMTSGTRAFGYSVRCLKD